MDAVCHTPSWLLLCRWALAVDPHNVKLQARAAAVDDLRSKGLATVPSSLQEEFDTNPFLRPGASGIRETLGISADAGEAEAFATVRKHKDSF